MLFFFLDVPATTSKNEQSNDCSSEDSREDSSNEEFDDDSIETDIKTGYDNTSMHDHRPLSFNSFDCDEPGCIKRFFRFQNLMNHHFRGDHVYKPDKTQLGDKAIYMFQDGVENVKSNRIPNLLNLSNVSNALNAIMHTEQSPDRHETERDGYILSQDWALLEPAANIRLSSDQIKFLNEKYEEGEKNGCKWHPNAVFEVVVEPLSIDRQNMSLSFTGNATERG